MAIQINDSKDGKIIEVVVTGKLTDDDYRQYFIPEFERRAAGHNRIRMLFEMTHFHGWEPRAAWDDLKLGMKFHERVERIAMVGEKKWQEWMAKIGKLFTAAEVRYFDQSQNVAARAWIEEGLG